MSIVLSGDSPNLTGANLSSPTISGTPVMGASVITSGTSVASTSGTSIDFTGIPSWVKRITVMFNGVSTSGVSNGLIQIGSGSVTTSGYLSTSANIPNGSSPSVANYTTGFGINEANASRSQSGIIIISLLSGNIYVCSGSLIQPTTNAYTVGGVVTLSGTLDRIRITTVNGTDTFDAGSINILYE